MRAIQFACALLMLIAAVHVATDAQACTGITLRAQDGSVIYARTMEFGFDFHSEAIVIPRGFALAGSAPDGAGMRWSSKHALVGANGVNLPIILDGLNEHGLACGLFYFPGFAGYQEVNAGEAARTIAPWELPLWILSQCATVEEVRQKLPEIRVANVVFPAWGTGTPAHYIVHDASGNCLVIEYVDGKINFYDNPIGVFTNAPAFDWHLTNLRNYVNLSANNAAEVSLDGVKLAPFGQGSGMHGLPGDFTPPSRFVRAAILSHAAVASATGEEAIEQAFHILNSFDIPAGSVRNSHDKSGTEDITEWTTASDTQARRFYFHTHGNRRVQMIDLTRCDLDAKQIASAPMSQEQDVEELTPAQK
jgi:choloylglycine hydrolase